MTFTWTKNVEKSSYHDRKFPVFVRNDLRSSATGSAGVPGTQLFAPGEFPVPYFFFFFLNVMAQAHVVLRPVFLIFMDHLLAELPRGTKVVLYADDPVMWYVERKQKKTPSHMHDAAGGRWACSMHGLKTDVAASTTGSPNYTLHR